MKSILWASFLGISLMGFSVPLESLAAPAEQVSPSGSKHRNGQWALLIGVSEYPTNPSLSLNGPKNDIILASEFLTTLGLRGQQMLVLADGVHPNNLPDGAKLGLPTHKAILEAFSKLEAKAKAGVLKQVFIHLSGHGSQQPDMDGDESDGLDELFLPRDIGQWDGKAGQVVNAIDDDTLQKSLDGIREAGANVIAVFDNCHSGTMTRGAPLPKDIVFRSVDASALGVPLTVKTRPKSTPAISASPPSPKRGGYVAFYAASASEETPEMKLDGQPQGLHTAELYRAFTKAILGGQPATYRQIAQQELLGYQARGWRRSTPQVEGTLLDEPIFGFTAQRDPVNQWPIFRKSGRWHLKAGSLHGMTAGSVLSIYSDALSRDESQSLGHVVVEKVTSFTSQLKQLNRDESDNNALKWMDIKKLKRGYLGRVAIQEIGFVLQVARPVVSASSQVSDAVFDTAMAALESVAADSLGKIELAQNSQVHIRTTLHGGDLIFMPPDAAWPAGNSSEALDSYIETNFVRVSLGNKSAEKIREDVDDVLSQIRKVRNIFEIAVSLPSSASDLETMVTTRYNGQSTVLSSETKSSLKHGSSLKISVKNQGRREVDVTALFVDSRYGIYALFPFHESRAEARIAPQAEKVILEAQVDTAETKGTEYLIIISQPVKAGSDIQEFTFLEQPSLSASRGKPASSVLRAGFLNLLSDAVHGSSTRGKARPSARRRAEPTISVFTWNTVD